MIDLNCDLGEGFPTDADLMPLISSANIACGFHAGDVDTMRHTIRLALQHGVAIGAHPGFADVANFGRIMVALSPDQVYQLVQEQLALFSTIAQEEGAVVRHIKPHGALYNAAAQSPEWASAIAKAVYDFDPNLILFGLSGSVSIQAAHALGLQTANEVFADRTYQADGTLTPRNLPNALIQNTDKCIVQVFDLIEKGVVVTTEGQSIRLQADTICLHGDGTHAISFAKAIRHALSEKKFVIQAPYTRKEL
jgi:UPF0271 protein